jgi:phosphoglycerol transferase MdoB-like AlkP superfamily enzyme
VGQVTDSVASVLRPEYLAFVVDIPVLIVAAVFLRRSAPVPIARSRAVLVALLAATAVFAGQVLWVRTLPIGADGLAVARMRGLAAYQVSRLVPRESDTLALASASSMTAAEATMTAGQRVQRQVEKIRKADAGPRIVAFPAGTYAGKNVIVIQVEALNGYIIGKRYDNKPITPNIDKLMSSSWYFPNTYSQTSAGNTSDAEFITNTSLYAPVGRPASTAYSVREIPALPRLLGALGYRTLTFHTNYVSFWNRAEMYSALGFNRYYDQSYFQDKDKMWHSSDEVLFDLGAKALRSTPPSTPVYAQFVTMTSHNPFRYPSPDRRPVQVSAKDGQTMVGRYIGSISYADKAIGEFVAQLKKDGRYDDSIIIVVGDHTAMSKKTLTRADKQILEKLIGRPYNDVDLQRVGMIVHLPGQTEPKSSDSVLGTVDIMPTIADLVGLDLSGTPHLGKSAFVSSRGLVPMRDYLPAGSFVNDAVMFEPQLSFDDGRAFMLPNGGPAVATAKERDDFERTSALSSLSDKWLNSLPMRPNAAAKQEIGF